MPTLNDLDLPYLDFDSDEFAADPFACYARARRQSWLAWTPLGLWVLGHRQVQTLLHDRRLGQNLMPQVLEVQGETDGPFAERELQTLVALDGADHRRLRKLVAPAFTPATVDRLRPLMRVLIGEAAGAVETAGRCEFVSRVARPYPIPVISALVGAPREDWDAIGSWAEDAMKIFQFDLASDRQVITAAHEAFDHYIAGLAEQRRWEPGEDLVSSLLAAEADGDRLSIRELSMLVEAVLTGGSDTTRNQLALAVWALAQHPGQWELLAERPELAGQAVQESLRWFSPIGVVLRRADVDIELDGVTVPAGTPLGLSLDAAGRDPDVHPEPDRFDITRTGEAPVLSFGSGAHYCLGASLARAELEEALIVLTSRWSELRLDGPVVWRPVVSVYGPSELPVAFTARSGLHVAQR